MTSISRDLLSIKQGIIVHQVNCMGVMGAGLALQVRNTYPVVYQQYRKAFEAERMVLGVVQFVKVDTQLWICNLAGQDSYGHNRCYTNYLAHDIAWPKVNAWRADHDHLPVYAPWKIGCGLAGGDWDMLQPLIEEKCPTVIWCRRE